jgi:hypothetical protein
MIGALAALLLSGGLAQASAVGGTDALPQLFIAACLDGQAKLSPGSAEAIGFNALPTDLQRSLGAPSSSKVWRLNGQGREYLYVLTYQRGRNVNPRVCGLASDQMDYNAAADAVEMRVTGQVQPRTLPSVEWLNAKGGYDALATHAGEFKVLQINWLSDAQIAEAAKVLKAIP